VARLPHEGARADLARGADAPEARLAREAAHGVAADL
jgi:hypothetical protein